MKIKRPGAAAKGFVYWPRRGDGAIGVVAPVPRSIRTAHGARRIPKERHVEEGRGGIVDAGLVPYRKGETFV